MVFGKKFPEFGFFPYGQMLDTLWDRANGLEVGNKELIEEYYRMIITILLLRNMLAIQYILK